MIDVFAVGEHTGYIFCLRKIYNPRYTLADRLPLCYTLADRLPLCYTLADRLPSSDRLQHRGWGGGTVPS